MKTALLQVADQGPLESLVIMLRAAGWDCLLPSERLRAKLRDVGCDTVLAPRDLTRQFGYDAPHPLPESHDMHVDLYVDVKAHRNGPRIWEHWPRLRERTLWYRINGGKPEHVIKRGDDGGYDDYGDEVNPPCPVLTPNQWYSRCLGCEGGSDACFWCKNSNRFYACWPPFARWESYFDKHGRGRAMTPPVCLIHNLPGWGYRDLVESMRAMGVRLYGTGSPGGLVQHNLIPSMLSDALCMVHLKSSDAPGYALYEALAAGCPVVCTRRLIWRCRMQELLVPGETCLVFDRETHDGLTPEDVASCAAEVKSHLLTLLDPDENRRIGMAGRARLAELMWREDRDGDGLREFMRRNFG